ncbi:unnamed protein product [Cylicocyclus nassatus]|uniref:Uncharacterized protein n=1 Tax=Cylicocyclus nassatus TaxID=53992 RepID=A0AA36HBV2_CYLNA|nr:unnamed protein product [Cylicocyclus nassatus]
MSATKEAGNLSQSALSYLQSLGKATKALRESQPEDRKSTSGQHASIESRLSSGRGSLSSMISQLRNRTRHESTIEESEDDKDMSGHSSRDSDETPSIDSHSSADGERIVFDFPYDTNKEDDNESGEHSEQLPDLLNKRKSIHDIRELRSSIDHSLIKPPKVQKQKTKRSLSTSSNKEDADSEHLLEVEEEPKEIKVNLNPVKKKSPFRPAVESGSDLESIDFEEDTSPVKTVHFKEAKPATPPSSSSQTSTSRTSSSSHSTSTSTSSSSSSSSKSKSSSASTSSKSSTVKSVSQKSSTEEETPRPQSKKKERRSSESSTQGRRGSKSTKARYSGSDDFESDSEQATIDERIEQKSSKDKKESKKWMSKKFCSTNLHHVTSDVLKTHMQLLKDFNRMEFSSLQEWNAILDDIRRKYEGPSTKRLEEVVEKRVKRISGDMLRDALPL